MATLIGGFAFSADGDLDLTYDSDGINSASFGASDNVYGGFLQSDGKLIVVGGGRPVNATQEFAVVRFNATGSIDTGFGTNGKYNLDITTTASATDRATCVGIQSDNKIIVGGYTRIASGNEDFAVIRLTPAGTLDTTFGTSGVAKVNFNNAGDRATDLAVLSDGSILICGNVFTDTIANGGKSTYGVAKLTSAGVLDTTFGTGGKAAINVGTSDDAVGGMDVQSDGKILIAGASNNKATIVRFTAAGVADTTFGTNGVFSRNLGTSSSDALYDVKFETGGKIVACGTSAPAGTLDASLLRVTSAGVLDTTFNTGYLVSNLGSTSDSMRCLVIQSDGKYLTGGFWANGNLDTVLLRTSNAGVLDSTFGTAGIKKVSVAAGSDQIMGLFVGADSKIVAAVDGAASTGQEDFYAARFQNTIAASEVAPTVTTATQTNVTYSTADLGGNVTADGGVSVTDRGIVWATSSAPTIVTGTKVAIGSDTGTFSTTVSSLPASTLIYVRAYATNTIDTSYGSEISFTTAAAPQPEIAVSGNSVEIPDGDTTPQGADSTSFGSVFVTGGSIARSFTITNTGAGALNLTGTAPNYVTLSGDTGHFSITTQPTTPVAATNGSTTFTVRFDPTSVGVKNATVTLLSNDADESPYTFAITGTGALQPGNLDITLDTDGRLTATRVGNADEEAYAVAVQSDGKILVGGYGRGLASATDDFMVVRYNANGTLDTTWDMDSSESIPGGIVTTDLAEGADVLRALKVLPNGKILAAGYAATSGGDQFALVCYNANGTLFTDFGDAGKAFANFSGTHDKGAALAVQADGKIVIAGRTESSGVFTGAIARFNTDGTLDATFDTDGMVTAIHPFGGEYTGVAIQPVTGRILVTGFSSNALNNDIIVEAYDATGALDSLFGVAGSAVLDLGYQDEARGIAVRPDGSIVVVGTFNDGLQSDVVVTGFTATGDYDYAFGYTMAGATTLDLSGGLDDQGLGIALRSDGRIAVIGQSGSGEDGDFGVIVLSPEGVPDESVSGTGIEYVNFFSDEDTGRAIAWDAQGYLVAVGSAEMGATGRDFAVARLVGPELPLPEIGVFDGDGIAGAERTDNTGMHAFGSINTGDSSPAQTFTIQNTGVAALTDLAVTVSGDDSANFTVVNPLIATLEPAETVTFTVTFSPTTAGEKNAVINIASNDVDENPFEINVSGTGVAAAGEIAVFDGAGTAGTQRTDNVGTNAFAGTFTGGGSTAQVFTIQNTGEGPLTGIAITAGGTDGDQFFIDVTDMLTTLAPNETTSFKVSFAPTTAGAKTGVINIASNDVDENPFEINVSGTANKPKMLIIGTNSFAADVVTKLQATGRFESVTYFAGNAGTPTLSYLQAYQSVLVFTDDSLQSQVNTGNVLADYVDGGGGLILATFCFEISSPWGMSGRIVTGGYMPISIGSQTGGDNLTLVPNIPGHPILNGVNSFNGGGASYHNMCAVNEGSTLVASWSDGQPLVAYKPVNGGSKSVMALNFYPPSSDIRADFWDASTDGIKLITNCLGFTGGIVAPGGPEEEEETAPEIAVLGNEVEIADGDSTPALADHTSFGSTAVTGGTVTRTFTIENQGDAALTLTGTDSVYVTLSGDMDHFSVTTQPSASVAVEGSTTFVITFDPASGGTKNAVVSILSNDADESPYTFAISGSGLAPEPVPSLLNEDVVTNGAAPGPDGTTEIGQFDLLRRGGFLAENGNLVFPGYLLIGSGSPAVTAENNSGIWKTSGSSLFMLARTGTTVPEVPGAQFATLPEVPGINESGEASFLATLAIGSGGVTTANDTGLWSEVGGSAVSLLVREDDDVPGLNGVKIDKFASGLYATAKTGTNTGEAAFSVTYKGASTKTAILRTSVNGATTTVSVIAQEGETAPGVTPAATFANVAGNYSDPGRMDGQGNFAFSALTTPGSKEGIWYQPRGGSVTKVFGAGDTAPGTSGATFLKLYRPSVGSNGYITFRGALSANGDNSANLRNDGIWAGTIAGGFNSILRRGDGTTVVSNLPGVGKVGNVWGGWVANSNRGAWKAWLDVDGNGTSAAPTDVNAIFTNLSGTMLLAVKAGDAAPGTAETFTGFDLPVVGGNNQYAFLGTLSGATATNQGLWKSPANGGAPVLVLRKGDTVDTTEGPQVVVKIDLPGSNQTDRRWEQPVMDDTGRMVIYITFADGLTSQILVP